MAKHKDLNDALDEIIDEVIVDNFILDGWDKRISDMSPDGMLALVISIIFEWMKKRVKPETPLAIRHKMSDDMSSSINAVLRDMLKEDFAK